MKQEKIKVLVVDDSPFARHAISQMISQTPHIEVIGSVSGGLEAMKFLEKKKPDMITLDIEMPEMNGFTFLKWLMATHPLPVLIVSSRSESQNVFKALELGALDFVAKPGHNASVDLLNVKEELIGKIEIISKIPRDRIKKQVAIFSTPHSPRATETKPEVRLQEKTRIRKDGEFPTFGSVGPKTGQADIVVIGASTGGPAAIQMIISSLPSDLQVPIVIVQHMPPNFTHSFAQRLDSLGRLRVKEAEEGDRLWPGQIYVAPGGYNLIAKKGFEANKLYLESKTDEDRYVPSVDKTMDSIAEIYGKGTLGVILTGMGNDGSRGIKTIKSYGGVALAESEETAVVYGMPRVPVQLGLIDQVFSIHDMAEQIVKLCRSTL